MQTKILITLLLITSFVNAQVTMNWSNYPNGVSIAIDSANNVYTAYWDYNPAGDITLTKRDIAGNILWNAGYNNTEIQGMKWLPGSPPTTQEIFSSQALYVLDTQAP